jgi:transcription elongation factor Elf1
LAKNLGKREKWTEEKIIKQLTDIYNANTEEFNSTFLKENYSKLNNAIYRKFKSLQNALNKAGIDYDVSPRQEWDYEKVRRFIEIDSASGCVLLSESFNNSYDELSIKCKCGNLFNTSFKYFRFNKKHQCDECGLKKSHESFVSEVNESFKDNIIVLEKYKGNDIPIMFNCEKHGDFIAKPNRILNNIFGCPKCGYEKLGEQLSKGERVCDICGSYNKVQEYNNTGVNYCSKHSSQMRRYGYIKNKTIKDKNEIIIYDDHAEIILLNRRLEETGRALISLDKIHKVKNYKWYLMSTGYVGSKSRDNAILLHRLITEAEEETIIDHINRNRLDCRNDNLRECTKSENAMNSSLSKSNTSGVTGVWYSKRDEKWIAEISANGKKYRLGRSKNIEEAIKLRKDAEKKYFGDFAPLRGGLNG